MSRPESERSTALVANHTIKEASNEAEPILQRFGINPAVYYQVAVNAILRNPNIATCEPRSLRQTLLICAERGLLPDGESAAIVPFKNKATLMVMVGGMYDLVRRVNKHFVLRTKTIFIGEDYQYEDGLVPALNHMPEPKHGWGEQNVIAAYAVAEPTKDSAKDFVFMFREEIEEKHRNFSRAVSKETPWFTHYERMCEKTVARALLRKYPIRAGLLSAGLPGDSLDDFIPPESSPVAEQAQESVVPETAAQEARPPKGRGQRWQGPGLPEPDPDRGKEPTEQREDSEPTAPEQPKEQNPGRKRSSWRDQNRF